jgi:hypothetical protein
MTLQDIYDNFTAGSPGFVNAVQSHCGFNMSDEEIKLIAELARNAAEFERIWEN